LRAPLDAKIRHGNPRPDEPSPIINGGGLKKEAYFTLSLSLFPFAFQVVDDNDQVVPHGTLGRVVIRVKPYRPVGLFTCYVVR